MVKIGQRQGELTVTIYSQPGCIFCGRARAWLEEHNIAYRERDITRDETAADELERMGLYATPAIVIDGQVLLGFNPEVVAAALAQQPEQPRPQRAGEAAADQGP